MPFLQRARQHTTAAAGKRALIELAPISRTVSEGSISSVEFKVNGAEIRKTGVESGAVIEGLDVIENSGASLGAGGKAVMIDHLV
jgi:hypothetical protein